MVEHCSIIDKGISYFFKVKIIFSISIALPKANMVGHCSIIDKSNSLFFKTNIIFSTSQTFFCFLIDFNFTIF